MRIVNRTALRAVVLLVAFACLAISLPAYAREALDTSRSCSLAITYAVEGTRVEGVTTRLYHVADLAADGASFEVLPDFAGSGVSLDTTQSNQSWATGARALAGYVAASGIAPSAQVESDASGVATASPLPCGLYLVVFSDTVFNGWLYTFQPSLVTLPQGSDGGWVYEASLTVKPERSPQPTGEEVEHKVVKHWVDDGSGSTRPQSITVAIIKDGVVQSEQVLGPHNDWSYSWTAPDDGSVWSVAELDVPKGYTVGSSGNSIEFIVTNTYRKPPAPPNEKPPRTGDAISWVLPGTLALVGVVCLGASLAARARRRHDG